MIDGIENLCEVQRNDGSKVTIVEITKHDVRDVKQFRRRAVRSTKTRLTGDKDIKIGDKSIKLWEADIFKQLWEGGGEIERKDEGEKGLL